MKLAIVILNWKGKALLQKFLPSVIEHSGEADIYVADNASTDNSVDFVKTNFSSVTTIQNEENGGYAKGYNDALKHVDADVFCLLNNDVEVTENWLAPIVSEFQNHPETAIVQPKILDYNQKDYFEYAGAAGGFIDKLGYPYCRGRIFNTIEQDNGQFNDTSDIFWASGACMFIRTNVFETLGGFDETFFAHMEEIDLCWRAFNQGYKSKYIGASTIYHVGGATLQSNNPQKTYLNFRNSLFALIKNAHGNLFVLLLTRLVLDGIAGIKFLLELKPRHTLAVLRAHYSFYVQLSRLLKVRKLSEKRGKYYKKNSIVVSYYLQNCKTFNCL
ncbi:MAG TPA: glycosyltransferase family 2 protein [Flavobacteriaceae bacterium]|nr:glycosyltransferase family 2 protein [Flavobacteriaceae bacterium]